MSIIDDLLPNLAIDQVAVFDQNFNQVFPEARPIKAVVKEQSKLMEHPIETGAIITDHRVILPVEIELSLILQSPDYENVYKTIRSYYMNATLLTVQTKSGIYDNQVIASMPHEEDPAQYNALIIALSLKQIQIVSAQFGVTPKKPSNSTTVKRGTQQGTTAPTNGVAESLFLGKPFQ